MGRRKWLFLAAAWVLLSGLSPFTLNNFQLTVTTPTLLPTLTVNGSSTGVGVAPNAQLSIGFSNGDQVSGYDSSALLEICNSASFTSTTCGRGASLPENYMNCTGTQPTTAIPSGICNTFFAPTTPSNYYMAWFANSTFGTPNSFTAIDSAPFTVVATGVAINALSVSPNSVSQGTAYSGTLTTTCSASCPNTPSYSLVTDATSCPTNNNSVFSLSGATLSMPAQSSSQTACVQVAVAGTNNTPRDFPVAVTVTANSPSITVNGASGGVTVSRGAMLTVAVNNGAGHVNDWVGICNSGVSATNNQCDGAPSNYDWDYLNCSKTQPTTGVTSATCSLNAPNADGSYVVNFFNQQYTNIYASAPLTVSTNVSGTGCSDASTLVGLPSGWACDTTLSDDFNGTGAEDSTKWLRQTWYPYCGGAVTINNDYTTNSGFQSGGAYHVTLSSTDGATYTWGANIAMKSAWWRRPGYGFPPNYYVEYRVRLVNSGIGGGIEPDIVSMGAFPTPAPGTVITDPTQSPAYTMMELDVPENNFITWAKWDQAAGGTTTSGGILAHDPSQYPAYVWDGNWHVIGWMRNGGLFTFFEDGSIFRSNMTPYDSNFTTTSDNWGSGVYLIGGCPSGTGTYDVQVDYVHVYHP